MDNPNKIDYRVLVLLSPGVGNDSMNDIEMFAKYSNELDPYFDQVLVEHFDSAAGKDGFIRGLKCNPSGNRDVLFLVREKDIDKALAIIPRGFSNLHDVFPRFFERETEPRADPEADVTLL